MNRNWNVAGMENNNIVQRTESDQRIVFNNLTEYAHTYLYYETNKQN